MPICFDRDSCNYSRPGDLRYEFFNSTRHIETGSVPSIHIGLINNMPDGALLATERQFASLLESASDGLAVRLSFYALPDVPRGEAGRHHVIQHYQSIEHLWNSDLHGLIVTGTEPRSANLKEEPYWNSLIKVIDWAELHTSSTIWSCLAAHAAILHMDGISRRRLPEKRCGVFECVRDSGHHLTIDTPAKIRMPHSRWNEVPEHELKAYGYRVLTRSKQAGADMFVKKQKSLFVFFQGHPEYEANTLFLEYRRDVGRYLRGDVNNYPSMPWGYFDHPTTAQLTAVRERALSNRREDLLVDFPSIQAESTLKRTWGTAALSIYRNWLLYLSAEKERNINHAVSELTSATKVLVQAAHF